MKTKIEKKLKIDPTEVFATADRIYRRRQIEDGRPVIEQRIRSYQVSAAIEAICEVLNK